MPIKKKKVAKKAVAKKAPAKKKVAHKKTKGKIVAENVVDRKPGKMYFVDGEGSVRETAANRKGAKKGHKVCK